MRYRPPAPDGVTGERYGVVLTLLPGDANFSIEVQRAPDSAGTPDEANAVTLDIVPSASFAGFPYADYLPNDGVKRWYRARHVAAGWTASAWTAWVHAKPVALANDWPLNYSTPYPLDRAEPLVDAKFVPIADDPTGIIIGDEVYQSDGVASRAIAKGHQSGQCRHGDVITFGQAFQDVPLVFIRGGLLNEPRSKWGPLGNGSETGAPLANTPQYEDLAALNLTAAGFTARGRVRQKGVVTHRQQDFTALNQLDTDGATIEITTTNAPSSNDQYTVSFLVYIDASITFGADSTGWVEVQVAIDSWDGSSWTERYTIDDVEDFGPGTGRWYRTSRFPATLTVDGLTGTSKFRVRVIGHWAGGKFLQLNDWYVHAYHHSYDPAYGLDYWTSTDQFASKTPDAEDQLYWEAFAVA